MEINFCDIKDRWIFIFTTFDRWKLTRRLMSRELIFKVVKLETGVGRQA